MDFIAAIAGNAALLAALSGPAVAEDLATLPAVTPASYRNECGSCHAPFPPGLLARDDWQEIMSRLGAHFGENAALAEPARREIEDFLLRYAGGARRFGARGEPPRLTSTPWFKRNHGAVRPAFRDPRIGSAANCLACHPQAERGSYEQIAPLARQLEKK